MRKIAFAFAVISLIACGGGKKKTADSPAGSTSLENRLTEYMQLTKEMKLEKLMDYIYPKLFTIAPKDQMLEAMKQGFSNEEVKVTLDSMKVVKIHPVFESGKGQYAKVTYSMIMVMNFTDKEMPAEQMEFIKESMGEKYGTENLAIDAQTGALRIRQANHMVAAKDEHAKEWSFLSIKEDDPTMNKLLSKEIQDKLATYN